MGSLRKYKKCGIMVLCGDHIRFTDKTGIEPSVFALCNLRVGHFLKNRRTKFHPSFEITVERPEPVPHGFGSNFSRIHKKVVHKVLVKTRFSREPPIREVFVIVFESFQIFVVSISICFEPNSQ